MCAFNLWCLDEDGSEAWKLLHFPNVESFQGKPDFVLKCHDAIQASLVLWCVTFNWLNIKFVKKNLSKKKRKLKIWTLRQQKAPNNLLIDVEDLTWLIEKSKCCNFLFFNQQLQHFIIDPLSLLINSIPYWTKNLLDKQIQIFNWKLVEQKKKKLKLQTQFECKKKPVFTAKKMKSQDEDDLKRLRCQKLPKGGAWIGWREGTIWRIEKP